MPAAGFLSVLFCSPGPARAGAGAALHRHRPRLRVFTPEETGGLDRALGEADLIVLQGTRLEKAHLHAARRCRAVIHAGSDCATDLEAARELGIFVCSISDAATAAYRASSGRILREFTGTNEAAREAAGLRGLRRPVRTGLVGFGRLGRAFAMEARALKMDVWAFDPFALEESFRSLEIHRTPTLHDLLGIADIVLIQVAPASSNEAMIGANELGWMKRAAWVVNFGWEPALEKTALQAALASGALAHGMIAARGGADRPEPGGIERFDPVRGREEEIRDASFVAALDLAERIARGDEPSPLLIDPPLPRWGA